MVHHALLLISFTKRIPVHPSSVSANSHQGLLGSAHGSCLLLWYLLYLSQTCLPDVPRLDRNLNLLGFYQFLNKAFPIRNCVKLPKGRPWLIVGWARLWRNFGAWVSQNLGGTPKQKRLPLGWPGLKGLINLFLPISWGSLFPSHF